MGKLLKRICAVIKGVFKSKKKEKVIYNYIPYFKLSNIELEISELVNDYRLENGLKPLLLDKTCKDNCDMRVEYTSQQDTMVNHLGIANVFINFKEVGLIGAEILARGYSKASSVVRAWKRSEGHGGKLLDPEFQYFSVAVKENIKGTKDYCILFAKQR